MKKFIFICCGLLILMGCQREPVIVETNNDQPVVYPKTIATKDTMYLSVAYIGSDATQWVRADKTFNIEKYFTSASDSEARKWLSFEDSESFVSISLIPVKVPTSEMKYDLWMMGNHGKEYRVEVTYYDKKAQGYPPSLDKTKPQGSTSGVLQMGGLSTLINMDSRPMVTSQGIPFDANRISIHVSFGN
ncbi:hypothetical protein [Bdellovibrio sp. HCB337]|uniref:hypothetical protein n=1 Tax=Bdellovibrio sp. HCB337 TaxID=3394358 RepID=UPI0039A6F420